MREIDVRKTQYSVADFMKWQQDGTLNLTPAFQRRSVWRAGAKSYFIDTVVRGLPIPIIYLRQRLDLNSKTTIREVVDGQQRLRTIFSYVNPRLLPDFNFHHDKFEVKNIHNKDISGTNFDKLSEHHRTRILEYEFSTHVLPADAGDREILEIFARLNATGEKLNYQELRNAAFFGELKTLLYSLALEQLERWTQWKIFNDNDVARMKEVELTSDLAINIVNGLTGKSQPKIRDFYEKYDDEFPYKKELRSRFQYTMDQIDALLGREISKSVYSSEVHFFSLFLFVYDMIYGLGSNLKSDKLRPALSRRLREFLIQVGREFEEQRVPDDVLDSVRRASADLGRRRTRLDYMKKKFNA